MAGPVILLVGNDPEITQEFNRPLVEAGFSSFSAPDLKECLRILGSESIDILLINLQAGEGMLGELLSLTRAHFPDLCSVVISTPKTFSKAVAALRSGADGVVLAPIETGSGLVESIQWALELHQQRVENLHLHSLRPLVDLGAQLISETQLDRLQVIVAGKICEFLRCDHAGIYGQKDGSAGLQVLAACGMHLESDTLDWKKIQSFGLDSLTQPARLSRENSSAELLAFLLDQKIGSLLWVPVISEKGNHIFYAFRVEGEREFRDADLEVLTVLAKQAVVAIENARLYAELQATIQKVELSQKALIQAEKMATAGRLTASIAHEINNPLQAVQNCLHLAGRKELSPQERQKYLDLAQSEMKRLMSTTQRMLDFYRPVALERKPVDLNSLIERVLLLLSQQLAETRIRVHSSLSANLPKAPVVADQIHQVILNLVINSIDAMPEGGDLFIETTSAPGAVQILIEDTGPGLPGDERERIFEPLPSSKIHGMGIGLSVSYGIITAHGGMLEYIDDRGRGACFQITLPEVDPGMSEDFAEGE